MSIGRRADDFSPSPNDGGIVHAAGIWKPSLVFAVVYWGLFGPADVYPNDVRSSRR